MGMDQKVLFPPERLPVWPAIVETLAARQVSLQMRMIDGQLAFPDELPPDTWRELRVAGNGGMVSLLRDSEGVNLVVWGNADRSLRETWNALAHVLAELTGGRVRTVKGDHSPSEFIRAAELPPSYKGHSS